MPKHKDRFHYENPHDSCNDITVYIEDDPYDLNPNEKGMLYVSVSEEQPFDSYNHSVNTIIHLPSSEAMKLRDYLNKKYR